MLPSILPIFLATQGRLIKQLIRAGAVSEETAMHADQVGLSDNTVLRKLLFQGVIGKTVEGKYYADAERLSGNPIWNSYIKRNKK